MDVFNNPVEVISMALVIILLLLSTHSDIERSLSPALRTVKTNLCSTCLSCTITHKSLFLTQSERTTVAGFYQLCGLPSVLGTIDGTLIAILKPKFGAADYYYFKSGDYSVNCQTVVDSCKRFLDLYVGMLGSMNDSHMLRKSTLYRRGHRNILWDARHSFNDFSPYLIGDAGYPWLPWLMVPHMQHRDLADADEVFNWKLSRGRVVVENAFAHLKMTFRELHQKTELYVAFVPDITTCCVLLHNVLLKQSHDEVERLLEVLCSKAPLSSFEDMSTTAEEAAHPATEEIGVIEGHMKRQELGVFLTLQRLVPV